MSTKRGVVQQPQRYSPSTSTATAQQPKKATTTKTTTAKCVEQHAQALLHVPELSKADPVIKGLWDQAHCEHFPGDMGALPCCQRTRRAADMATALMGRLRQARTERADALKLQKDAEKRAGVLERKLGVLKNNLERAEADAAAVVGQSREADAQAQNDEVAARESQLLQAARQEELVVALRGQLSERTQQLQDQVSLCAAAKDEARKAREDAAKAAQRMNTDNANLQAQLSNAIQEITDLKKKLVAGEEDKALRNDELEQANNANKQLAGDLEEYKTLCNKLSSEQDRQKEEFDKAKQLSSATITEIQTDLSKSSEENADLKGKLAALQTEHEEVLHDIMPSKRGPPTEAAQTHTAAKKRKRNTNKPKITAEMAIQSQRQADAVILAMSSSSSATTTTATGSAYAATYIDDSNVQASAGDHGTTATTSTSKVTTVHADSTTGTGSTAAASAASAAAFFKVPKTQGNAVLLEVDIPEGLTEVHGAWPHCPLDPALVFYLDYHRQQPGWVDLYMMRLLTRHLHIETSVLCLGKHRGDVLPSSSGAMMNICSLGRRQTASFSLSRTVVFKVELTELGANTTTQTNNNPNTNTLSESAVSH
ncbi:hypothetical protein Pelo_6028 [Pelomyxa schiedti]|nr:hypothetical protein Pelo_6028 [Pelomyxa schiedti]